MASVVDKVVAVLVPAAKKVAKAVAVGAGVAALTAVANEVPAVNAGIGNELDVSLSEAAVGQITALIFLAREAVKAKGE